MTDAAFDSYFDWLSSSSSAWASSLLSTDLRNELAAVDATMALAQDATLRPDARVRWLTQWIKGNLLSDSS